MNPPSQDHEIFKRIHNDLVDSFDEELEMEVEDGILPEWQVPKTEAEKDAAKAERRQYFRELFRMQGELRQAAGMGRCLRAQAGCAFRGQGRRGQGWGDQTHHTKAQSPRLQGGRVARAEQPRADAMVFSTLCHAPSCCG